MSLISLKTRMDKSSLWAISFLSHPTYCHNGSFVFVLYLMFVHLHVQYRANCLLTTYSGQKTYRSSVNPHDYHVVPDISTQK